MLLANRQKQLSDMDIHLLLETRLGTIRWHNVIEGYAERQNCRLQWAAFQSLDCGLEQTGKMEYRSHSGSRLTSLLRPQSLKLKFSGSSRLAVKPASVWEEWKTEEGRNQ